MCKTRGDCKKGRAIPFHASKISPPPPRSNVQCDEFDTDLTQCKSDNFWELENSCSHAEDVGIRCYPATWSGIRLGMTAHESHMKGVVIEKAGLLDYTTRSFKPGEEAGLW